MNGNGWAGSNVSGVKVGRTELSKYSRSFVAFDDREVVVIEDVDPASASAGRISSRYHSACRSNRGRTSSRAASHRSRGVAVRRLLGHAGRDLLFQPADALAEELRLRSS